MVLKCSYRYGLYSEQCSCGKYGVCPPFKFFWFLFGSDLLLTWLLFWISWMERCKTSELFPPVIPPMSIMRSKELLAAVYWAYCLEKSLVEAYRSSRWSNRHLKSMLQTDLLGLPQWCKIYLVWLRTWCAASDALATSRHNLLNNSQAPSKAAQEECLYQKANLLTYPSLWKCCQIDHWQGLIEWGPLSFHMDSDFVWTSCRRDLFQHLAASPAEVAPASFVVWACYLLLLYCW